ncbi:SH3 domain containing protein [Entamoeba histolytica HM-1:IMSS-B]|uniref:SH3 domain-containing protein n=6 Tax=Entamoeba histolytica TaxID=5759 RepID=C4LYW8_ENTH1|nr:hypothetical protein EHI_117840 [Entamoeba histolytica HM-1:IMSS]EAL50687.2 hypothetical protein EHI_117840 [Entamoeba histolytica HM-1:IMSS]EMD42730.1 variant SH3 domain containing protein, putative [Entamoeba histolytica KU27]EMH73190.1 SH3 domain containing protein [Entamoeba histolytica HM-1:IMSS-B]ENY63354.1 variant sh3 domain containing protein [Entamoeba histolytica HM-1:IMSS-A]|eukprot:XP_656072.2 hypothetical protein EHI_117840 [Entamoeba histolytica HM-1:IMSS]
MQDFLWDNDECIAAYERDVVLVLKEEDNEWSLCKKGYNTGYLPTKILKKVEYDLTPRHNKQMNRMTMGIIPQPTILPCRCISRYDFIATSDKEVSFCEGDEMIALSSDLKWVYVQHPENGFGYIPTNYVIFEKEIYNDIVNRYGLVIFDYNGDSRFHLNAIAGDVVYVEEVIGSWAICKVGDKKYIMPYCYIKILEDYDQKTAEESAFVLSNFTSEGDNELNIVRNEFVTILLNGEKWSLVRKGNNVGYVPSSFLSTIHDGENYALISENVISLDDNNVHIKQYDIWKVLSKEDNNVKLIRGGIETIVPLAQCDIRRFEKTIKREYEEGKKRIEETMLIKEKEIMKRDEEEREQREVRYKEKKQTEQKEFIRQTMRMKKSKTSSKINGDDFLKELEKKKMLYESSENTDMALSSFTSPLKKTMTFTKPTQRGNVNFLNRQHKPTTVHHEEKEEPKEEPKNEEPKEEPKNEESIKINKSIFEGLIEENKQLKQQIEMIDMSQKDLLKIIFDLKDELKKIKEELVLNCQVSQELEEEK